MRQRPRAGAESARESAGACPRLRPPRLLRSPARLALVIAASSDRCLPAPGPPMRPATRTSPSRALRTTTRAPPEETCDGPPPNARRRLGERPATCPASGRDHIPSRAPALLRHRTRTGPTRTGPGRHERPRIQHDSGHLDSSRGSRLRAFLAHRHAPPASPPGTTRPAAGSCAPAPRPRRTKPAACFVRSAPADG
jgi:hypothetical protein